MFHGQNRNFGKIINPGDIPTYGLIWIDNDTSNLTMYDTNRILSYSDVLTTQVYTCKTNSPYSRPNLKTTPDIFNGYQYSDYYGIDPNNPDERYAIETNWATNNIINTASPLIKNATFFAVIDIYMQYDTSFRSIWNWRIAETNADLCLYYYGDGFGGEKIGFIYTNKNASYQNVWGDFSLEDLYEVGDVGGHKKFILAATTRTIWINGIKVLDITGDYPLNVDTELDTRYEFLGGFDDLYGVGSGNSLNCPEILMYGEKLTDSNLLSVVNWLNDKYQIYT